VTAYRLPGGLVAVVERQNVDGGFTVWVGELRDSNDQPIRARVNLDHPANPKDQHFLYPVTVGTSEAEVLAQLRERAAGLTAP
jgi:hypothetical protein